MMLEGLLAAIDDGRIVVFDNGATYHRYDLIRDPSVLRLVAGVLRDGLATRSEEDEFGGYHLALTGAGEKRMFDLRASAR